MNPSWRGGEILFDSTVETAAVVALRMPTVTLRENQK